MAQQCAICGVQMNVFQSLKLSDGNYICRKTCKKRGLKYLEYHQSDIEQVVAHNAQVERGNKLWEHYFIPRKKTKQLKKMYPVFVAEDIGLMAVVETRYKFFLFGKTEHVCVYRIADLYKYDIEKKTTINKGKSTTQYFIRFLFLNVEGLFTFRKQYSSNQACKRLVKYFDTLFGIQKTLGNIANTWSNQMGAMKSIVSTVKAAASGEGITEEHMKEVIDTSSIALYGDRTKWIEKADAALKEFNN